MTRFVQIAVSLVITVAALWYSLHGVDFDTFLRDFGNARLIWVVPLALSAAACLWLRALRWRILLENIGPLGDTPVFHATCIGFMGNMVLPLRAGEAIKPIVVARSGYVTFPAALATVALERLCDLIMLGLFALLTLAMVPSADFLHAQTPTIVGSVLVVLVVVFAIIRLAPWLEEKLDVIGGRLPGFLRKLVLDGGRGFLRSLGGLSDMGTLLPVFSYTALIWLSTVAGFIAVALALEIDAPLIALGFASTVIVALAVSVPSAPGFIGVFWAGSELALSLFGIPKSMGFTFGVMNWLAQLFVIVGLGMWSMSRLHISFGDVRSANKSSEAS